MVALIGYAALGAAFVWVCWQVSGAYADYRDQGEALEEQDELIDALTQEVRDLEEANMLLAADNHEQRREIYHTRQINRELRQEVRDADAAMNPTRN